MSYHGHRPTPPRSILVIVGGMIAWAGLVGGVLIATPEYHRALTMKSEPVEMTWQKLAEQGLSDNSYVRLIGVELDEQQNRESILDLFAPLEELGSDSTPEEQQAAFEQFVSEPAQFAEVADIMLRPIKVIPQGVDAEQIPATIVIPPNALALEAAKDEIAESGTLTGRFVPGEGASWESQLTQLVLSNAQQSIDAELPTDGADETLESTSSSPATGADERLQNVGLPSESQWVFEPVDSVPSTSEAQQWFWICGFAVAFGMVLCGAGGPSITCCLVFQGPSILSLFGYPLRYGRGSNTTRIVYACAGMGMLAYGYQTMVVEGRFGKLDGDITTAVLGYVVGALGAASLLGAFTNTLAHRLNVSLDPRSIKTVAEPTMSMADACSLDPRTSHSLDRYTDPDLVDPQRIADDALDANASMPNASIAGTSTPGITTPGATTLGATTLGTAMLETDPHEFADQVPDPAEAPSETLQELAQLLAGAGFDQPRWMTWREDGQSRPALVQLGCQEMVVAEAKEEDGQFHLRLVSILQDGLAIVSLSPSAMSPSSRFGTSGLYEVLDQSEPVAMLSRHLEQTVGMAEKRHTAVVAIDACELADAVLYGRRVLADIRSQYGEDSIEVGPASYGRFQFPVAEIPQLATSTA